MGKAKDPAAVALARKRWTKLSEEERSTETAPARAKALDALRKLSPDKRAARARKAAKARWAKAKAAKLKRPS